MEFFKIFGRALRDVYESFMYFILVSLAFWVCCVPMIFGYGFLAVSPLTAPIFLLTTALVPPALLLLYALTDPRRVVDRIPWSETVGLIRSTFIRSWQVALITLLPLVMIAWNISYFAGTGHTIEIFVPLWIVMLVFIVIYSQYCYSLAGTHESGWRNSFRGAMFVLVKYPIRSILLSLFTIIAGYMFFLALLPMLVIGPAFFAAIINRFVFDALEVHVIDPNSPTDERAWEASRGINPDRTLVERIFRRDKG